MIEQTVQQLTPIVETRPTCRALGASQATIYRRRQPPRSTPVASEAGARESDVGRGARGGAGRAARQRFVDCSSAEVWATSLDEGRYLACARCTGCWLLSTAVRSTPWGRPPARQCRRGSWRGMPEEA
jgi:putative transposase